MLNDCAELAPMLAAVENELEKRNALIKTRRADLWFFETLLYTFRDTSTSSMTSESKVPAWENGPVWTGPRALQALEDGTEAASVLEIVRRAVGGKSVSITGVWSRSLAIYRSSPLVAVARGERSDAPASWTVIDGTPRAVFAEFLKNIFDFLVATRELVATYDSLEKVERNANVWRVMRDAQTPVIH